MNEHNLKKKLTMMIVTVILLSLGLAITSLALAGSIAQIRNNRFAMSTGINLKINGIDSDGDGPPVVDMNDILFEPGGTYKSEFSVANDGTFDVWYRIYFTDVEGALKDHIIVTVKENEENGKVLCSGKMSELSADQVKVGTLEANQQKTLSIEFYFPSDVGNNAQGQSVSFNITANATQMQNNPGPNPDFGN